MTESEVLVDVSDGVGRITLNRPRAINALTAAMMQTMSDVLLAWQHDLRVESVELRGAGDRGLCSGADVRALREVVLAGGDYMDFFDLEYALDGLIATYPKPYTAFMTGITMGGGLGLSAHASRRVVDASSRLAMPETIIGFEPDVGVLFHLAKAPGELGTYLALTGNAVGAADAILVGLADECDGECPPGELAGNRSWIDECFAGDDPVAIITRLEAHDDPRAAVAASDLRARSPLSVAVALEAIRRALGMVSVSEVLVQDAVLARNMIAGADFIEGVRAQLVDKDRNPRWQHARLEDVSRDEVLACFTAS